MVQNLKQQQDKNMRIIQNLLFFVVVIINIIMHFVFKQKKLVNLIKIISHIFSLNLFFFSTSTTTKSFSFTTTKYSRSTIINVSSSFSSNITAISWSSSTTWSKWSTSSSLDSMFRFN